jgi:hypothetical protein
MPWCQAPIWDPRPIFHSPWNFLQTVAGLLFCNALSDERTGLYFNVNCFWTLPEQSLLGRNSVELTAIFYCLIWDSPNLEGQVSVFTRISPRNSYGYSCISPTTRYWFPWWWLYKLLVNPEIPVWSWVELAHAMQPRFSTYGSEMNTRSIVRLCTNTAKSSSSRTPLCNEYSEMT